jgi:hypothetical protein
MKILVAYDGSTSADAAIQDLQTAGLPSQAEALVVCVEDGRPVSSESTDKPETGSEGSWQSKLAEAEKLAEKARKHIVTYFPEWTISVKALWGSPVVRKNLINLSLAGTRPLTPRFFRGGTRGEDLREPRLPKRDDVPESDAV